MNHNWSATKQHLHLQSVAEISRHSVLSGDRIRQCGTLSGSRHKDTISSYRHRSVPVPCENGSAETTVAEGGRNPVARLWGHTQGENWPLSHLSVMPPSTFDVNWTTNRCQTKSNKTKAWFRLSLCHLAKKRIGPILQLPQPGHSMHLCIFTWVNVAISLADGTTQIVETAVQPICTICRAAIVGWKLWQ